MRSSVTIGVIGGAGWLGGAIVSSLVNSGTISPEQLVLSSRRPRPGTWSSALWTSDNQELVDRSDIVILSVRPADFPTLRVSAHNKLVISVMAGVTTEKIQGELSTTRVIRLLPNAAAKVARSYTPWIASPACTEADRKDAKVIFDSCGFSDEVDSEHQLDYFAGLSGTGPAFPALLADAMRRDAIRNGINSEIARRAVSSLLIGAGRLLEKNGECPADTVEAFVGYRGITAAAIEAMHAAGFDAAVRNGLAAANQKSAEMGEHS